MVRPSSKTSKGDLTRGSSGQLDETSTPAGAAPESDQGEAKKRQGRGPAWSEKQLKIIAKVGVELTLDERKGSDNKLE